jgi:hypothetical protein
MMNGYVGSRYYVIRELEAQGVNVPKRYKIMISNTPDNKVIEGLTPWAFLPNPERSQEYSSSVVGRVIFPFAQAIGNDLIACFQIESGTELRVIVINPQSINPNEIVRADLDSYEAWIDYAQKVSDAISENGDEEED